MDGLGIILFVFVFSLNCQTVSCVDCFGLTCTGTDSYCCGDSVRRVCCTYTEYTKNFCTWDDSTGLYFRYRHCSEDCCGTYYSPDCCESTTSISGGTIAGAVVGSLVFFAFVIAVICCCKYCCSTTHHHTHTVAPAVFVVS